MGYLRALSYAQDAEMATVKTFIRLLKKKKKMFLGSVRLSEIQ